MQSPPQLMPAGVDVTVPPPPLVTVNVNCFSVNDAVTVFAASMVTMQPPVPVQAPDHPVNVEVAAGVAINVTAVPAM